jgi:hypothetical protein
MLLFIFFIITFILFCQYFEITSDIFLTLKIITNGCDTVT